MSANHTLEDFTKAMLEKDTFTCVVCKNLLQPPITLVKNLGNICQPCFAANQTKNSTWICVPNPELDKILKNLIIPCKFQGCQDQIIFDQLVDHETKCIFRPFTCLLKNRDGCQWSGRMLDFSKHFIDSHQSDVINIVENNKRKVVLQIDLSRSDQVDFVKMLKSNGKIRFLLIKSDNSTNSLSHTLFYDCKNDKTSRENFDANLKYVGTGKFKIKCPFIPLEDFNGAENQSVKINLSILTEISGKNKPTTITLKITTDKYKFGSIHDDILLHLQCPVCRTLMRSPIFQCNSGHSLCHECHAKFTECPACQGHLGDLRNFCLESLTDELHFCCTYQNFGCDVVLLGRDIADHENFCAYKTYQCPFDVCKGFSGEYGGISAHFRERHSDYFVGDNPFKKVYMIPELQEIFHLGVDNNVYKLSVSTKGNAYYFNVTILNKHDKKQKYVFEIKILHKNDEGIYKSESGFIGAKNQIVFYENDIASYKNTLSIKYSCKIFKV